MCVCVCAMVQDDRCKERHGGMSEAYRHPKKDDLGFNMFIDSCHVVPHSEPNPGKQTLGK